MPILVIIILNACNWYLIFKARTKILLMKNPILNSTYNILSILVIHAVQATLIMNWITSAFRLIFFCMRDNYYLMLTTNWIWFTMLYKVCSFVAFECFKFVYIFQIFEWLSLIFVICT